MAAAQSILQFVFLKHSSNEYILHRISQGKQRNGNRSLLLSTLYRSQCKSRAKLFAKPSFVCRAQATDIAFSDAKQKQQQHLPSATISSNSLVLEIQGMMCGSCAARVRNLLLSDSRVESVAVNMLTEMATVRLKRDGGFLDKSVIAFSLITKVQIVRIVLKCV